MIRRLAVNVDKIYFIVLDVDGSGASISKFIGMHKFLEFFLYTFASHKIKDGGDRYRVILPLENLISSMNEKRILLSTLAK